MRLFGYPLKRLVSMVSIVIAYITYKIVTDPDAEVITGLSYGADLVMSLEIFLLCILLVGVFIFTSEIFQNKHFDAHEEELYSNARKDEFASALVIIANKLELIAFAIIVASAIFYLKT